MVTLVQRLLVPGLAVALGLTGCTGTLTFGGTLWPDDDDDSGITDDDDTSDDDDSSDDDDDDTGPIGGEVFCGPTVTPGGAPASPTSGTTATIWFPAKQSGKS